MQLVLHDLEKGMSDFGILVVVNAALLVNVRNLEIEPSLACSDLANPLEQIVEIILSKPLVQLWSLVIQHKALDDEFPQRLRGPNAKLRGLGAVHAVANRDNRVEVVMLDLAPNLPTTLLLNRPNFLESCLRAQFPAVVNLLQMIAKFEKRSLKELLGRDDFEKLPTVILTDKQHEVIRDSVGVAHRRNHHTGRQGHDCIPHHKCPQSFERAATSDHVNACDGSVSFEPDDFTTAEMTTS